MFPQTPNVELVANINNVINQSTKLHDFLLKIGERL